MKMTFEKWCGKAAGLVGGRVEFFDDGYREVNATSNKFGKVYVFEDDGFLHIVHDKVHACFDVSLYDDGRKQNEIVERILDALGIPITDNLREDAFVEDDDDCCPECGRPF